MRNRVEWGSGRGRSGTVKLPAWRHGPSRLLPKWQSPAEGVISDAVLDNGEWGPPPPRWGKSRWRENESREAREVDPGPNWVNREN